MAKASKRNAYLESKGYSVQDLAKKQTRSIENKISDTVVETEDTKETVKVPEVTKTKASQTSDGPKSISDIANLLKNRNDKGDK